MWFPEDLKNTPLIQEFRFDIFCSIRLNEIYTLPSNSTPYEWLILFIFVYIIMYNYVYQASFLSKYFFSFYVKQYTWYNRITLHYHSLRWDTTTPQSRLRTN